jgi:hypothetical protein
VAKSKPTPTADPVTTAALDFSQSNAALTDKEMSGAIKLICAITGCGRAEAALRAKSIDCAKLLQLDKAGQRAEIVALVY